MTEITAAQILLIEDDPGVADLVRTALEWEGHVVTTALDGGAGLTIYRERTPDCVVLDVMLPDVSGWEVLRAIRATDSLTQILMVTGLSAVQVRVTSLEAGADDYLAKPFAVEELRARVAKRLAAARRLRDLATAKEAAIRDVVRRYSSTIPHELNQPLSTIVGHCELIRAGRLTPEQLLELVGELAVAGDDLAHRVAKFAAIRELRTRQFAGQEFIDLADTAEAVELSGD